MSLSSPTGKNINNYFLSDVKTSKRLSTKTPKRQNVKTSNRLNVKNPANRKRHTIYLSAAQSKKLRVYGAANDIQMSEVVEKLINDNLWRLNV